MSAEPASRDNAAAIAASFRRLAFVAGALAAGVGALVLVGWVLDVPVLKSVHPDLVSMKANTALGFLLAGLALCVRQKKEQSPVFARRLAQGCAIVVLLIGLLVLGQILVGWDLRLDQLLVTDPLGAVGTAFPGRLAPTTALDFILIGAALLLLDSETRRGHRPAQWLALAAGFVAALAFAGQVFGTEAFLGVGRSTQVAVHTTAANLALCVGLIFARPESGLMRVVASASTSGRLARRMLPVALLLPLVLGGSNLLGLRAGLYGAGFAMALFAATQIGLLVGLTWWGTGSSFTAECEQRRSEQSFAATERRAESRLQALFEGAPDAMLTVGAEGRILTVNRRCESLLGYQPEELVGQPLELLIPERLRTSIAAERARDAAETAPCLLGVRLDQCVRRKDGVELPVEVSLSPVETETGKIMIAAIRDITERKRVEEQRARTAEELQRAQTDFRQVIDKSPDGITIRRGRTLLYVNPAFAAGLGYADAAQLVGVDIFDLVFPEDREIVSRRFLEGQRRGVSESSGIRTLRRDGTVAMLAFSPSQVIEFEGAPAHLTVVRDMTERNKMEARLLLSDRMVSVGILAAGVAHEINNPLAAAVANLEVASKLVADLLLAPGAASSLVELDEVLRDVREGAERVRLIVRDLKIFSRSEEEKVARVDVHRVLDSTLRMAWNEVRHRARLVKDYGKIEGVAANEARLGQVFLNLVVNAAQAIPEGRAEANEIRVVTRMDGCGRVVIEVRDTGPGIPPNVEKQLFTPFFTTKAIGTGTGLGLSICHRIVTGLGGEIEVESQPGEGAVFRVSLLAAGPDDAELQPARASTTPAATRRGRILIVDDDAMVAKAMSRILSKEHEPVVANGAIEAMKRIVAGERFDAILCDLMMPDVTGMDFHGQLEGVAPDLTERVIFVTGGAFTPKAEAFLSEVPNVRLEKPVDSHNLLALVRDRVRQAGAAS